jgi:hypothetical protein
MTFCAEAPFYISFFILSFAFLGTCGPRTKLCPAFSLPFAFALPFAIKGKRRVPGFTLVTATFALALQRQEGKKGKNKKA